MNFKVHPKEKLYFTIGSLFGILFSPILLLLLPSIFILNAIISSLFIGSLRGNAIKINKNQFGDIFEILESHSKKLNLKKTPDMYLLQGGGILNAFAIRFASRNYVVLYSDVLEIAYQEGIDAVSFVIGHELGHIKRGHTSLWKTILMMPSSFIPFFYNAYSRAREYTCDNIGYALSPQGAVKGMLVLAAGKKLYKKVNADELIFNMKCDLGFAVTFAELFSTHPVLVKRVFSLRKLQKNDLSSPENSFFISPKVDTKSIDQSSLQ